MLHPWNGEIWSCYCDFYSGKYGIYFTYYKHYRGPCILPFNEYHYFLVGFVLLLQEVALGNSRNILVGQLLLQEVALGNSRNILVGQLLLQEVALGNSRNILVGLLLQEVGGSAELQKYSSWSFKKWVALGNSRNILVGQLLFQEVGGSG